MYNGIERREQDMHKKIGSGNIPFPIVANTERCFTPGIRNFYSPQQQSLLPWTRTGRGSQFVLFCSRGMG